MTYGDERMCCSGITHTREEIQTNSYICQITLLIKFVVSQDVKNSYKNVPVLVTRTYSNIKYLYCNIKKKKNLMKFCTN